MGGPDPRRNIRKLDDGGILEMRPAVDKEDCGRANVCATEPEENKLLMSRYNVRDGLDGAYAATIRDLEATYLENKGATPRLERKLHLMKPCCTCSCGGGGKATVRGAVGGGAAALRDDVEDALGVQQAPWRGVVSSRVSTAGDRKAVPDHHRWRGWRRRRGSWEAGAEGGGRGAAASEDWGIGGPALP